MRIGHNYAGKKFFIFLLSAFAFTLFFSNTSAYAYTAQSGPYPENIGFFSGESLPGIGNNVFSKAITDCEITSDYDCKIPDKQWFINYIDNIIDSPYSSVEDTVGAYYIVQTMRGLDASGNYDRLIPSDSDRADWRAKVLKPYVVMDIGTYSDKQSTHRKATSPGASVSGTNTDVARFTHPGNGTSQDSILFYSGGSLVYAIQKSCANPLGNLPGLKTPPDPTPAPTPVDPPKPTGSAGECRPRKITINPSADAKGNVIGISVFGNTIRKATTVSMGTKAGEGSYSKYITSADTVLNFTFKETELRWIEIAPTVLTYNPEPFSNIPLTWQRNYKQASSYESVTVSSGPCYNYRLTPSINSDKADSVLESGAVVKLTPDIQTVAAVSGFHHTNSDNTNWRITKLVLNSNVNIDNKSIGGAYGEDACPYYRGIFGNGAFYQGKCTTGDLGSGNTIVNADGSIKTPINPSSTTGGYVIDDYPVGTRVCYAFSVNKYSSESSDKAYYHSNIICNVIVKKPKTQILGGDLIVGRNFGTGSAVSKVISSTSVKASKAYGSWVEYGILATGSITGTGSASAFSSKSNLANVTNQCSYSKLSFNNALGYNSACSSAVGKYKTNRSIPDVASSFPTTKTLPDKDSFSLDELASGASYGTDLGHMNFTINSGSKIPSKKWVVINAPSSTVTISGNIEYSDGPYTNTKDVPQVVVIAKNINIAENVTNIDAWLVAGDTIDTCSRPDKNLSSGICSGVLKVNGPLMAGKLLLRRTAGSGIGQATGDPAEVFNLRADTYLWASARAKTDGVIKSVYTSELPPRF